MIAEKYRPKYIQNVDTKSKCVLSKEIVPLAGGREPIAQSTAGTQKLGREIQQVYEDVSDVVCHCAGDMGVTELLRDRLHCLLLRSRSAGSRTHLQDARKQNVYACMSVRA